MPESATICGKQYQLAEPYRAAVSLPVGREPEQRLVQAAMLSAGDQEVVLNVLLFGEPGMGKTSLAQYIAQQAGLDLYVMQGNEGVMPDDLAVTARPSDEGTQKIDYVLSGLATAMLRGGCALIDEVGKMRPRSMAVLASVGDHRRVLHSTLAAVTISAHPAFRLICTANSDDLVSASIPDWMAQRLSVRVRLGPLSQDALCEIVRRRFLPRKSVEAFLSTFWEIWAGQRSELPTPRQLIHACQFAFNLLAATGQKMSLDIVKGALDVVL